MLDSLACTLLLVVVGVLVIVLLSSARKQREAELFRPRGRRGDHRAGDRVARAVGRQLGALATRRGRR